MTEERGWRACLDPGCAGSVRCFPGKDGSFIWECNHCAMPMGPTGMALLAVAMEKELDRLRIVEADKKTIEEWYANMTAECTKLRAAVFELQEMVSVIEGERNERGTTITSLQSRLAECQAERDELDKKLTIAQALLDGAFV